MAPSKVGGASESSRGGTGLSRRGIYRASARTVSEMKDFEMPCRRGWASGGSGRVGRETVLRTLWKIVPLPRIVNKNFPAKRRLN